MHSPTGGHRVKESLDTHNTGMSSSVYPLSSPTDKDGPGSPHSFLELEEARASLDAEAHAFDADDISYRLRLLVNNNYFLPPAHAKPSLAELAPPPRNHKAARPSTPKFFDYFRKPRTNVASPAESPVIDITGPILRNTGDTSTVGGYIQRAQAAPPSRTPGPKPVARRQSSDRAPKVVVVRERLDDLFDAAKQAERELNAWGEGRKRDSPRVDAHFIDPTDVVDVVPPREGQSELHGLGIRDSVGAAVLAEQLPPPGSPFWSTDTEPEDTTWRKQLLHEAVSFSLSNTGDSSFKESSPSMPSSPTPPIASNPERPRTRAEERKPNYRINERIMDPQMLEEASREASPSSLRRPRAAGGRLGAPPARSAPRGVDRNQFSFLNPDAPRAETPAPSTPLSPPPRKALVNPIFSLSQTDLPSASAEVGDVTGQVDRSNSLDVRRAVRKSISSPMLASNSNSYDTGGPSLTAVKGRLTMTPPPSRIPRRTVSPSHSLLVSDPDGVAMTQTDRMTDSVRDSMMSQFGYSNGYVRDSLSPDAARPSMTSSLASRGRQSYDHSRASPTASVFQDAWEDGQRGGGGRTPSPFAQRSFGMTMASRASRFSYASTAASGSGSAAIVASIPSRSASRYSNMSPPPRPSSSFQHVVLPPPPRRKPIGALVPVPSLSVPGGASETSLASSSQLSLSSAQTSSYYSASPSANIPHILAPEPTTPPFPLVEGEGSTPESQEITARYGEGGARPTLTDLLIPGPFRRSGSIRSAPEAASPTAFFDQIQENTGILDDMDDSDESESEQEAATAPEPSVYTEARAYAASSHHSLASPRPSFMRLGNHSSPSVAGSASASVYGPQESAADRKRGIANVPVRRKFFSRNKRDGPSTPLQLYQHAQGGATASSLFMDLEDEALSAPPRPHSPASSYASAGRGDAGSMRSGESGSTKDETSRRLEGMFAEHMSAERDKIRRIAGTHGSRPGRSGRG